MNPIRSSAAIAVASGVAVASLALPAAAGLKPAQPPTTHNPTAAAAGYLARQLAGKHHDHLTVKVGTATYADDGETSDAVLSLDAAGVAQSAAKRATKWLEKDATNYMGTPPDVYPGSAGKLLLVAEAQHVDPTAFGPVNLFRAIIRDEGAAGAPRGEYQNPGDTKFGASVLNQSLAVLALANTNRKAWQPSARAVSFLRGQECANHGFQLDIRNGAKKCARHKEDIDTTAYAVQALVAAGRTHAAAAPARWLRKVEASGGGWGETPGAKPEANSTAIAVEALIAVRGNDRKGETWLSRHTLGCGAPAARRGSVRFQGRFEKATAVRATSQAVVALAGVALTSVDRRGAHAAAPVLTCPAHHHSKN